MASGHFIGHHNFRESGEYERLGEGRKGEKILISIVIDCELDPRYFLRDATKNMKFFEINFESSIAYTHTLTLYPSAHTHTSMCMTHS